MEEKGISKAVVRRLPATTDTWVTCWKKSGAYFFQ